MKKLTVVIPCKDDRKIKRCILSIDPAVCEAFVVFNGAKEGFIEEITDFVQKEVPHLKYKFKVLKKPNLAEALEVGTRYSESELVLYMDSDCTFERGCIDAFLSEAERKDMSNCVLKGKIIFDSGDTWLENIIAISRTHHTADVLTAYKPPLLISKRILPKIGGYAFDTRLIWREDSDLDNRIRQAGIQIVPVESGIIYHGKITLKTDLRSTFRYGIGLAIADRLQIKLTEVPRSTKSAFQQKGLKTAAYMLLRNRIYDLGYIYATIQMKRGKKFGA